MAILMNNERRLKSEAVRVFRRIFADLANVRVASESQGSAADRYADIIIRAESEFGKYLICIETKARITPQTALSVCDQLLKHQQRRSRKNAHVTAQVVYSPVISPRVAEVLRQHGVGYADRAGNCWLQSRQGPLLIERQGFRSERQPTPPATDPFSTKSSRIIRALLTRPGEGWQLRKLAAHPEVRVSVGLAVKVKRALVEEGFAVERERRLYLRDPLGLLNAWSAKYPGPVGQIPLYFRGETAVAEDAVGRWCRVNNLQFALAGFSAAWRIAPEVRYTTGAAYVHDQGFDESLLEQLTEQYGGKRVETGATMYLWRPYDPSVFAFSERDDGATLPFTSALQTYLDLKRTGGRGEDAAKAIFERCLAGNFTAAAEHDDERRHATV